MRFGNVVVNRPGDDHEGGNLHALFFIYKPLHFSFFLVSPTSPVRLLHSSLCPISLSPPSPPTVPRRE